MCVAGERGAGSTSGDDQADVVLQSLRNHCFGTVRPTHSDVDRPVERDIDLRWTVMQAPRIQLPQLEALGWPNEGQPASKVVEKTLQEHTKAGVEGAEAPCNPDTTALFELPRTPSVTSRAAISD